MHVHTLARMAVLMLMQVLVRQVSKCGSDVHIM